MTERSDADDLDLNDPAAVARAEQAAWDEMEAEDAQAARKGQDVHEGAGTGEQDDDDPDNDTSATETDGDRGPAADQHKGTGQAPGAGDGGQTGGSDQDGQGADPWADAPEPLRAEKTRFEKRISGQDAKIQRLTRALEQANRRTPPQQTGKGGTATDRRPAGFTSEQWKQFQEDAPEYAKAIQEEFAARDAELQDLRGTVGGLSQAEGQRQVDQNLAAVKESHPDLETVVQSQAYADWYNALPPKSRALIDENGEGGIVDPDVAIWIIDQFKASQRASGTGATPGAAQDQSRQDAGGGQGTGQNLPGKRQRQMETATPGPRSGGPRIREGEPPENASEKEWWDHMEREERRKAS